MDLDNDEIRIDVPLDLLDVPSLRRGATISPDTHGMYSAIQAGADTTATRDTVTQLFGYDVPANTATATLVNAAGDSIATAERGVDGGQVSGTLDAPAGDYDLVVTACTGSKCATATSPVTDRLIALS